jgi:glutaredoxin
MTLDIEIFSVPNCSRCAYLKELLDRAGLDYIEVDVSSGLGPLRWLKRLSGAASVPWLVRGRAAWTALTQRETQVAVEAVSKESNG